MGDPLPPDALGRVLLLNANADERELYRQALVEAGFEVLVCADARDAMRKAVTRHPDVLLTRVLQPSGSIDGVELTRQIKADSRTQHVCVVMTLSLREVPYRKALRHAGCDESLVLPSSVDDVVHTIKRLLARPFQQQSA
jgi:chemosensory pili system protein ChpA (sensor histidine kinase/response regulator)